MCFDLVAMYNAVAGLFTPAAVGGSVTAGTTAALGASTATTVGSVAAPSFWATMAPVLQTGGLIASGLGAFQQAQAANDAAAANAQIAEWQAQDAQDRGAKEEQALRMKAASLKGGQRASLAARGLDLGAGSALDILVGTDYMAENDALTIQANTEKEVWARRNQASLYGANQSSPLLAGAAAGLSGVGSVADSWYRYNKARG